MGLFKKIGEALRKTREAFSRKIDAIMSHGELDDDFYDELEEILLTSDVGAETTLRILDDLRDAIDEELITDRLKAKEKLKEIMTDILNENEKPTYEYPLIMLVAGGVLMLFVDSMFHQQYTESWTQLT